MAYRQTIIDLCITFSLIYMHFYTLAISFDVLALGVGAGISDLALKHRSMHPRLAQ
jgi:hypothetical protein